MTQSLALDLDDVAPLDREKAAAAVASVRFDLVTDPDGPAFDAAYRLMDTFFGPRGELEDRAALADFVRRRVLDFGPGLEGVYHLVVAWDRDRLVGVRDCYVDIDHTHGVCVVALSHSLVVPEARRTGVAAVLRALPVTLARRVLAERVGRPVPTLIAAEMEPVDPDAPDTIVRLVAYGRSGFSVLDPTRLRYSQPDFRELGPEAAHVAIPLVPVVRPIGVPEGPLPAGLAAAYPRMFHACHRLYLPAARVDPSQSWAMRWLGDAPVPLLPLPTGADTLDRLAPLVRGAVVPLYPPELRGPDPAFGDPVDELARVRAAWRV